MEEEKKENQTPKKGTKKSTKLEAKNNPQPKKASQPKTKSSTNAQTKENTKAETKKNTKTETNVATKIKPATRKSSTTGTKNTQKAGTKKSKTTTQKSATKTGATAKKTAAAKSAAAKSTATTMKVASKTQQAKKAATSPKTVSKKPATSEKVEAKKDVVTEEELEQENLIAQVENVSEQAEIYEQMKKEENNSNKLVDPKTLKLDQLEAIKNEIKKNKKSNTSKNNKKQKYSEILKNTAIFILIQIYFIIIMIGNSTISAIRFINELKVVILIEAVVSIIIFEIAYKKDSTALAFHGIEVLGIGIATVVFLDLYNRQSIYLHLAFVVAISVFLLYYIIKMLVISLKKKK